MTDPLDVRLLTERWLAGDKKAEEELNRNLREHPATGLETASEFDDAGLGQDATAILSLLTKSAQEPARVSPLAYYYLAHFASLRGDASQAASFRTLAQEQPPDCVFPFQWEFIPVLREAITVNPRDSRAPYYLGNLLFDSQPAEAVKLWQQSAALDSSFAIVHRNLAAACLHQKPESDTAGAIAELEQAVNCNVKYALHFTELDQAYAAAGVSPEKRLALLERNQATVLRRDDALCREISLKVFAGKCDEAIQLMGSRKFAVWEGGSLSVADDWINAHLARGRQELSAGKGAAALADFQAAKAIPDNLPSDQGGEGRAAELAYWIGAAYDALGDKAKAAASWQEAQKATRHGRSGRGTAGQVQVYYQALAQRQLGETAQAENALRGLLESAQRAPADAKEPTALSHYLAGLGHLGLGETQKAKAQFELALQAIPDSLGPKVELAQLR
jgi:tetratricopeptide (TPR) repeat protein